MNIIKYIIVYGLIALFFYSVYTLPPKPSNATVAPTTPSQQQFADTREVCDSL